MNKNDGGPAFPFRQPKHKDQHLLEDYGSGMSLRDAFALAALQGLSANPHSWDSDFTKIAAYAYDSADAMIFNRNGRKYVETMNHNTKTP